MNHTYKTIDGKLVTCAVVIINADGDILGVHPNGNKKGQDYDFPKGCAEENELDITAAVRELQEETDLYILKDEFYKLIDLGIHPHNKKKNIHLFMYKVNTFPVLEQLKCTSLCEKWGTMVPEVNEYAIIKKNERNKFMNTLQDKFEIIDSFNK